MKIVRLLGKESLRIDEIEPPKPARNEVLVKAHMSALCGSELNCYRDTGHEQGNSGHEAVGVIVELGSAVDHLVIGERIGVSAIAGCGKPTCHPCQRGESTWCPDYKFYGGMHAEYFVIAACAYHKIPDDVPIDIAVLISGDGLGVPYHTAQKTLAPKGNTVAIFGMGSIGLGSVLLQAHLGRKVIAVDLSPPSAGVSAKTWCQTCHQWRERGRGTGGS